MSEPKEIFKALLTDDNKIQIFVYSNFIPVVNYAHKLLEIEIEKRIISGMIQEKIKNAPNLIVPGNGKGIINAIRGGNA